MILEIESVEKLVEYVDNQLRVLFGETNSIQPFVENALNRAEFCFTNTNNKYYFTGEREVKFSHLHSVQNAIFLYYLSRSVYVGNGSQHLCDSIYYLNRMLNGVDWYYQVELPAVFGAEHPLGSILGKAKYSDGFFVYQGVTIGGNKGKYPVIGKNVVLYSDAKILGHAQIGNNVVISANSYIKDEDIPDNCLVFGTSPNLIIKQKSVDEMKEYFQFFKRDFHR